MAKIQPAATNSSTIAASVTDKQKTFQHYPTASSKNDDFDGKNIGAATAVAAVVGVGGNNNRNNTNNIEYENRTKTINENNSLVAGIQMTKDINNIAVSISNTSINAATINTNASSSNNIYNNTNAMHQNENYIPSEKLVSNINDDGSNMMAYQPDSSKVIDNQTIIPSAAAHPIAYATNPTTAPNASNYSNNNNFIHRPNKWKMIVNQQQQFNRNNNITRNPVAPQPSSAYIDNNSYGQQQPNIYTTPTNPQQNPTGNYIQNTTNDNDNDDIIEKHENDDEKTEKIASDKKSIKFNENSDQQQQQLPPPHQLTTNENVYENDAPSYNNPSDTVIPDHSGDDASHLYATENYHEGINNYDNNKSEQQQQPLYTTENNQYDITNPEQYDINQQQISSNEPQQYENYNYEDDGQYFGNNEVNTIDYNSAANNVVQQEDLSMVNGAYVEQDYNSNAAIDTNQINADGQIVSYHVSQF